MLKWLKSSYIYIIVVNEKRHLHPMIISAAISHKCDKFLRNALLVKLKNAVFTAKYKRNHSQEIINENWNY